ncbi:hypothetical protein [Gemmata sp.]|uniref:hypothetical protein n=1 Tax=Gemmata sp. TaxID=1914242 RepID=UPI003F72C997
MDWFSMKVRRRLNLGWAAFNGGLAVLNTANAVSMASKDAWVLWVVFSAMAAFSAAVAGNALARVLFGTDADQV